MLISQQTFYNEYRLLCLFIYIAPSVLAKKKLIYINMPQNFKKVQKCCLIVSAINEEA